MRSEMRMGKIAAAAVLCAAAVASAQPTVTVFSEDFQGLTSTLIPNVNEPGIIVWTETPPAGWTTDDTGIPGYDDPATDGVTEWAGWSFANKDWWVGVAGDQDRSLFSLGSGTVMIADPDEYDDLTHTTDGNYYNAYITIDNFDVSTVDGGTLSLNFDSSWRPECCDDDWGQGAGLNNQTAIIEVRYDSDDPGDWVEVLKWTSNTADATYHPYAVNENVTVDLLLPAPAGAGDVDIRFGLIEAGNDWWWAVDNIEVAGDVAATPTTLLTEDFDSLPLGAPVDEVPGPNLWTPDPPAGWVVDRSSVPGVGDPAQGVEEWEGWSFPRAGWWAEVAGDAGRKDFSTDLENIIAVVDPDEWDDLGDPESMCGTPDFCYDTSLTTPLIDVSTVNAVTTRLKFKSSWRQEDRQRALVEVKWDGGAWEEILRWESDQDPNHPANFKDDDTNQELNIPLAGPVGAGTLQIRFSMEDAGNDWWWAIDDIEVTGSASAFLVMLDENFDGLSLNPCVDEQCNDGGWTGETVWSNTPPAGWSIDNTTTPGIGDPTIGVTEWEGWGFADPRWWNSVCGQGRGGFTGGTGVVAIADGDEWDDMGDPDSIGLMNTILATPAIDVSGTAADTLTLNFASSWLPEDLQTAVVTAQWDAGAEVEILKWVSDDQDPDYHGDNIDEAVSIDLNNPLANTLVLRFKYLEAGNDWWWAIDNIEVTDGVAPLFTEDFESVSLGLCVDEWCTNWLWTHEGPVVDTGVDPEDPADDNLWTVDNTDLPGIGDPGNGVVEWEGWSFADVRFWTFAAGDGDPDEAQDRQLFDIRNGGLASGIVAVADGDEWDDVGDPENLCANGPYCYNTILVSPVIDITGELANELTLEFDSSWREEDRQTAVITVQYDGGAEVEVMRWESSGDPDHPANFKDDAVSEHVTIVLNNPAPLNELVVNFKMLDAGNDWWWAIDNVELTSSTNGQLFFEDFETAGLEYTGSRSGAVQELSPSVLASNVWTDTPPTDWTIDDSGVPGDGTANDGVTEWSGWSFADRSFWIQTDFQDREEFLKSSGVVAVADPDEWDDQPHELGTYTTKLITPAINLLGAKANTAFVAFDSSWRPEDDQKVRVTATFDIGSPVVLMNWTSDSGDPDFKPDATNESLLLPMQNPAGASEVTLTFEMYDAGNDWWWAIDNIFVFGAPPANDPIWDVDEDTDVDMDDFAVVQRCLGLDLILGVTPEICFALDINGSGKVDTPDLTEPGGFDDCQSGAGTPADTACDD